MEDFNLTHEGQADSTRTGPPSRKKRTTGGLHLGSVSLGCRASRVYKV